jgi:oxalate decarboxylase/phosphoglucose isomerase-like protein (cupin superfamily)
LIGDEKFMAEPRMVVFSPPEIKHQINNTGKDTFIAHSAHCPPGPEKVVLEYMKKKEPNVSPRSSNDSSSANDDENSSSGKRFPMELNFVN